MNGKYIPRYRLLWVSCMHSERMAKINGHFPKNKEKKGFHASGSPKRTVAPLSRSNATFTPERLGKAALMGVANNVSYFGNA